MHHEAVIVFLDFSKISVLHRRPYFLRHSYRQIDKIAEMKLYLDGEETC